jgi:hypothetical protein
LLPSEAEGQPQPASFFSQKRVFLLFVLSARSAAIRKPSVRTAIESRPPEGGQKKSGLVAPQPAKRGVFGQLRRHASIARRRRKIDVTHYATRMPPRCKQARFMLELTHGRTPASSAGGTESNVKRALCATPGPPGPPLPEPLISLSCAHSHQSMRACVPAGWNLSGGLRPYVRAGNLSRVAPHRASMTPVSARPQRPGACNSYRACKMYVTYTLGRGAALLFYATGVGRPQRRNESRRAALCPRPLAK